MSIQTTAMKTRDLDAIKKRMTAWHECAIVDRMPIIIRRDPGPGEVPPPAKTPADAGARCWDPDFRFERILARMRATRYLGDAMPYADVEYGNVFFALFWGAEARYPVDGHGKLWLHETVENWEGFPEFRFDPENPYYRQSLELADRLARESRGEYFTSPAWSNSCGDILAALRDSSALATDLIDCPEEVARRIQSIQVLWPRIMKTYFDRIAPHQEGHVNWYDIWAPGTNTLLGCDFSSIISPAHFQQFFLPEIQAQSRFIEYPLFHLDGRGEIPHLDALLDIPELRGIQWVNDDFSDTSQLQYVPMFRKILSRKKCLTFRAEARHARALVDELGREGLLLNIRIQNLEEAEPLLKLAAG